MLLTLSGNVSKHVLTGSLQPNFDDLKRLIISCKVAATMKYSCFNRSSLPSKNYKYNKEYGEKRGSIFRNHL